MTLLNNSSSKKVRVLIADDSGFMRLLIRDILASDPSIEVVGTAENGKEAFDKTKELKPDVVLLDIVMPKYDGVYAVKKIMQTCPTSIVILSSLGHTNINPIMESMELGAFDYINKPVKGNAKLRDIDRDIVRKVRTAAASDVSLAVKRTSLSKNINPHVFSDDLNYNVIVIGASTGGPSAIEQVVANLPSNLKVPVLIAQHMPENFVPSFALRLNGLVPLEVKIGTLNMPVKPGQIIIAPGNKNMVVKRKPEMEYPIIDFSYKKYKEYNHPSVDALMTSVSEAYGDKSLGVILTGMGRDGAQGMQDIKAKGGFTIAQDKETCAVFGMPREAIERNCIDRVVKISDIGGFIISCLS